MIDRIGQRLGHYRLIRKLGSGGFADVYQAEHIYLNTPAAVKLLNANLASGDIQNFHNEARTIARLVHPHIVRILDFGMEESIPYLVMEYAPNGTMRQRHPKGTQVPLSLIVKYVRQVASALQHAHTHRLIHRDVKPENLLLGGNNELLLGDFGAALLTRTSLMLSAQNIIGTISYMAPEQLQGRPSPASDQYALGIVVYEWLCGSCPFQGPLAVVH
ncbi:MAG: serine/threonine protein kinase, partial [Chloroflexi bacterium]